MLRAPTSSLPVICALLLLVACQGTVAQLGTPARAPADGGSSGGFSGGTTTLDDAGTGGDGGWVLTWSDEFDGPDGGAVDPGRWVFETGGDGWGNQELELYRAGTLNAYTADGALHITAAQVTGTPPSCWYGDCLYTSARLKTAGKFAQTYGRFEARIRIPAGQGIWPAFWLLGEDIDRVSWPRCGEIDIMENIGRTPATVYGTLHGPNASGQDASLGLSAVVASGKLADGFHLYAVEWEASEIRFYLDEQVYATFHPAQMAAGAWVFDHPFFILLNVAVGGQWPGSPDGSTVFPAEMVVDYVRVYSKRP